MHKYLNKHLIILLSTVLLLQGCKTLNPSVMFKTDKNYQFEDFTEEKEEYVIKPFDKIDLRVYTNDGIQLIDMQSSGARSVSTGSPYLVDHEGMLKAPTLGWVKISEMTIKEAEHMLENKYSQFYQKPFVLINVTNRRVVVFTAGSTNGHVLNIENEQFTLVEALAQAGGIDDFSKAYKIKLLRGDLNNPKIYIYNISSIEEMQKANMVLQANDIIYVEKRPRYASRTLTEVMPYVALINTFILMYLTIYSLTNN